MDNFEITKEAFDRGYTLTWDNFGNNNKMIIKLQEF